MNWIHNLRNEITRIQREYEEKKYANDTISDARRDLGKIKAEKDLIQEKITALKEEASVHQIKFEELQSMKNILSEIKSQITSLSQQRQLIVDDIKSLQKQKENLLD